jgi:hypothetical protein
MVGSLFWGSPEPQHTRKRNGMNYGVTSIILEFIVLFRMARHSEWPREPETHFVSVED